MNQYIINTDVQQTQFWIRLEAENEEETRRIEEIKRQQKQRERELAERERQRQEQQQRQPIQKTN